MAKTHCPQGHEYAIVGKYNTTCKACTHARAKVWTANNPEKHARCVKNWTERNPLARGKSNWKARGIITPEGQNFLPVDYDRAYQIQQGKCKMCGIHQTNLDRLLAADHSHQTGIFRGLLCFKCNWDLGIYERIKSRAKTYLGEK